MTDNELEIIKTKAQIEILQELSDADFNVGAALGISARLAVKLIKLRRG